MKLNNKNPADYSKLIPDNLDSGTSIQNKIWKRVTGVSSLFIVIVSFVMIGIVVSLNEILDLPHLIFEAPPTPVNWIEVFFELFLVFLVSLISIHLLLLAESKHKRAEEKIKEQNEFLNNVIDSIAYPFYVINANDYRIKLANSAACLGSLSKNSTCHSLTHESSKPCEGTERPCPLDEVKKTKKPVIVEHIHYDKEGNLRNVEVHGHPIFDNDGNVVQMIEYSLDITERKRAEEEIRKKNEEMEAFVYMVSHDLKNPVISIQGFCSLLTKKHKSELNEKTLFYIERVQANASLMASLLEDLVELSRIGRIEDKKREISVQEVIESVWNGVSRSLPVEGVEFVSPESLPQIFYSEKRLYQIFYNLLSNAVKFKSENKTPRVEIGCRENEDNYTFFVRDNGIGIDQKYHDKIFEVFSQLKEIKSEGTGMGLAIVKKIVEASQGKVWVESQKGAGSTFYFTVPKKV